MGNITNYGHVGREDNGWIGVRGGLQVNHGHLCHLFHLDYLFKKGKERRVFPLKTIVVKQ